jgi:hypothetical protein
MRTVSVVYYCKSRGFDPKGYVGEIVEDNPRCPTILMKLEDDNTDGQWRRFSRKNIILRIDRRPVYMVQVTHVGYATVLVK